MNTIGKSLRLTIFGSSHGEGVGCVLDGVPPGLPITVEEIQKEVDLRRPAEGIGTPRHEEDMVQVLSGSKDGLATGGAITLFIANKDRDSSKYLKFRDMPRPGHADYTAVQKYGDSHDIRGGGQFSGRLTAPIVAAGAVARKLLTEHGVTIGAYTESVGRVIDAKPRTLQEIVSFGRTNDVRAAAMDTAELMRQEILDAKAEGDSVGGTVRCVVEGLPVGVGEPFFDTVEGELAKMMFAIPAVKGIEFGAGFRAVGMRGSECNDPFIVVDGRLRTSKNDAGGVLGGITNGMPVEFRVAFKPTASISKPQRTVDLREMSERELMIEGRHDPCIVPRAVSVVEAAAALVLADLMVRGGFID
ncbi:MAG: chorismate synthase [Methanomassiliicoccales archaeon PtaU1.Bin124]|nr:MAG: chorismate synthase [Methanomassiliicoccales archaeon PtaU1.Bin124]